MLLLLHYSENSRAVPERPDGSLDGLECNYDDNEIDALVQGGVTALDGVQS